MGYMFCYGACLRCGQNVTFNVDRVPSFRGKYVDGKFQLDPNGTREPVCRACFEQLNAIRVQKGLEPWVLPSNAYEPEEVL